MLAVAIFTVASLPVNTLLIRNTINSVYKPFSVIYYFIFHYPLDYRPDPLPETRNGAKLRQRETPLLIHTFQG